MQERRIAVNHLEFDVRIGRNAMARIVDQNFLGPARVKTARIEGLPLDVGGCKGDQFVAGLIPARFGRGQAVKLLPVRCER